MLKKIIQWASLVMLIVAMYMVAFKFEAIKDWWHFLSYEASADIASLADRADLSEEGQRLFFRYNPTIETKSDFNTLCDFPENNETSKVVGCFNGIKIYVLDIEEGDLEEGEVVTSAHEMLHAAYHRLSETEREILDKLLLDEIEIIENKAVLKAAKHSKAEDPENYKNELHSIIGTEVREISPKLEEHYSQFFNDRLVVVKISEEYSRLFADLEIELAGLEKTISDLVSWINSEGVRLENDFEELDQERLFLQGVINAGDFNENIINQINGFKAKVTGHNDAVTFYRQELKRYEDLAEAHKNLSLEYIDLTSVLDGYEPQEIVE